MNLIEKMVTQEWFIKLCVYSTRISTWKWENCKLNPVKTDRWYTIFQLTVTLHYMIGLIIWLHMPTFNLQVTSLVRLLCNLDGPAINGHHICIIIIILFWCCIYTNLNWSVYILAARNARFQRSDYSMYFTQLSSN